MTLPKTKKLFISYRSSDAVKVDKIASDLALLKYTDSTVRYITWQDKHNLPPASPNWWDAIVDAIIDCDMFIFNLSRASLQSEVCRAELDYAHKRNRPIIPVVLKDEFFLDPKSGKYDLLKETWALIPDWLRETQLLFYIETVFYAQFQTAVEVFERNWSRDIPAPRPLNPDNKSVHGSNHALYDAACDYARRLAFTDSEKHFDALVRRNDSDYADAAAWWLQVIRSYAELIELDNRRSASFIFRKRWATYITLFPREFLEDPVFDPRGFAARGETSSPAVISQPTAPAASSAARPTRPTSVDLLPVPFAWIEIPKKGYSIAKYPITNTQFAKFVEVGGYREKRWWTEAGWQACGKANWTEPRFWLDSIWNGAEQPVVGVSWYESVAFCLWLSDVTGEKIMLPTEEQWQYAAKGHDGQDYPWGMEWNGNLCNNNVDNKGIGRTTPVRQYEGKGDSPFGVVDMAGNIWEWCMTDYDRRNNNANGAHVRVLGGGSWFDRNSSNFRCSYRGWDGPDLRDYHRGFRLALSY